MCKQRRRGKHCARGIDFDGSKRHEHFSHETDALEFEFVLRRNRERIEADMAPIPEPITFGRWVEKWLEARKRIRPRATWQPEEERLRRLWLPRLSKRKLASVFSSDIATALETVTRGGRSNATRNRHRAMLHTIFEAALRQQPPLVLWNPVKSVAPLPENWRSIERVILDEVALEKYVAAARVVATRYATGGPRKKLHVISTHWPLLAKLFTVALLRPSEALAVTAGDFEKLEIEVEKIYCKTENTIVRRTKGQRTGGSYRTMLLPTARLLVQKCRRTLSPKTPISGGMSYDQVLRLHRQTLKQAKLPRCGLRVFRHSVARLLKTKGGFSSSEIQELLGHESIAMTMRYTKTGIGHLVRRAARSMKKKRKKRKKRRVSKR